MQDVARPFAKHDNLLLAVLAVTAFLFFRHTDAPSVEVGVRLQQRTVWVFGCVHTSRTRAATFARPLGAAPGSLTCALLFNPTNYAVAHVVINRPLLTASIRRARLLCTAEDQHAPEV